MKRVLYLPSSLFQIVIETSSTSLASGIVRLSAFSDFRRFAFLLLYHFLVVPSILGEDALVKLWTIHGHA